MSVLRPLTIAMTILALVAYLAASCVSSGPRPDRPTRPAGPGAGDEPAAAPGAPDAPRPDLVPIPDAPEPDAAPVPPADAAPPGPAAPPPPASAAREPPRVRVVLSGVAKTGRAAVVVDGGWTLQSLDGRTIRSGVALRGDLDVGPRPATLAGTALPDDGAVLVPARDGDLRVGAKRYPGVLRVARTPEGRLRAQVELDVETYLEGVVAGELIPGFPRESMRAQAIVARTYLLTQPGVAWDAPVVQVDDSGLTDQEFAGIAGTSKFRDAVREAVLSTRGIVVFDGPRPLRTWYHSTCGGHTTDAAPVFNVPRTAALSGVPCGGCGASAYHRWAATIPSAKILAAVKLSAPLQSFDVAERSPEGRATTFEVRAGGKRAKVRAADFRLQVGPSLLRSVWLDSAVLDAKGDLAVAGRGWGHGVGLCQWGARGMARDGASGEAIVAHYYPGAELRAAW